MKRFETEKVFYINKLSQMNIGLVQLPFYPEMLANASMLIT